MLKNKTIKIFKKNWLIVFILLVGAFLRLYKIDGYMTFLGDEGRDVLVVKRMIVDCDLTFLGPTASVGGFFLGPLYYYLMAPFLWIFRLSPVGPAVMVALFGIATIYLVYLVGKTFFNKRAAYMASSLYALSPLVISYSRSSWNPNLVPFFSLLLIYSLYKSINDGKKIWFILSGICIGAGLQFHYLFAFLIPISVLFLIFYRKKIESPKSYLSILLGVFLPLFPFIGFEIKNHFPNTRSIYQFILAGKEVSTSSINLFPKLADLLFRLFGRLIFYFPPPEQLYMFNKINLLFWQLAILLTIIFSTGLLIYQLIKTKKSQFVLLFFWLFFGICLFYFYQRLIYDYYFGIMFALPFLLLGNLFSFLMKNQLLKFAVLACFIGLILLNWSGRPFKHAPNRQLKQAEDVSRFVFEKAEMKPFNFALITGSNSDHAYRYFFEIWENPPITIENEENDPERKTVADQLLVICEVADCKPLGHPLWEIAGFGRAEIAGEWQVGPLKVIKLVHFGS